jgi:phospholipase/carboxylesterase
MSPRDVSGEPLTAGVHRIGRAIVAVPPRVRAVMVFFHGAGGDATQSERMCGDAARREGIVLVCPSAQAQTWDLLVERRLGRDFATMESLLETVHDKLPLEDVPLALAGFSDGASYALTVGLVRSGVDAILAFSPGFSASTAPANPPRVFLSHGVHDRVLPVACTRRIRAALEPAGSHVRVVEFDGGHVPDEILDDALAWFLAGR